MEQKHNDLGDLVKYYRRSGRGIVHALIHPISNVMNEESSLFGTTYVDSTFFERTAKVHPESIASSPGSLSTLHDTINQNNKDLKKEIIYEDTDGKSIL